jgi:DNA-binding phage protein
MALMGDLTKPYRELLLESLQDSQEAAAYITAALEEGDSAVFLLAVQDVVESIVMHKKDGSDR